ncbi:MAG: hypothetical protein LYZ66_01875 [Nitrososphaerales archaeon]|nr:hypothetical protein [Nitrososphaerales archaeon]
MSYIYEVGPVNYFNLVEPERNSILAAFAAALQQLSSAVVFRVKLDKMSVVVGSDLYNISYRRYFLESNHRLDGFLAAMGMQEKFVRLVNVPGYSISTTLSKYVVLDGGDLAKAYTITGVASDLDVAFLAMEGGKAASST